MNAIFSRVGACLWELIISIIRSNVTTAASIVFILPTLPLCPSLQPHYPFPWPLHFYEALHSLSFSIHPLDTLRLSPPVPITCVPHPATHQCLILRSSCQYIYQPLLPSQLPDCQCCFVPLLSSLFCLNLNPNPNLYLPVPLTCTIFTIKITELFLTGSFSLLLLVSLCEHVSFPKNSTAKKSNAKAKNSTGLKYEAVKRMRDYITVQGCYTARCNRETWKTMWLKTLRYCWNWETNTELFKS